MQPGIRQDNYGGRRLFESVETMDKKLGRNETPHDGPARIVKPKDWGAVQDLSMKDFSLSAFEMPGRAAPKSDPQEVKVSVLNEEVKKIKTEHQLDLEKLKREMAQAVQLAEARGREEGLRVAEENSKQKYDEALAGLQKNTLAMLDLIQKEKASLFLEFEGQALELVSGCIHRVFENLAAEHIEAVLPLLKRAVSSIGEASSVTIKVHPQDFETVEGNQAFWLPVNASLKDIRILADNRIAKGGCFVESDATSVSAHAQEMADRIDEELKNIFLKKIQSIRNQQDTRKSHIALDEIQLGLESNVDSALEDSGDDLGESSP